MTGRRIEWVQGKLTPENPKTGDRVLFGRGLPGATITTDSLGRAQLTAVTEPTLRLEVPGFAAVDVDLKFAITRVELQSELEPPVR